MRVALVVAAAAAATGLSVGCGTASADATRQQICTAYNTGEAPSQIADGIQDSDGRVNMWQAQREVIWPVIAGDCDPN
jgi:hypothetical protein